MALRAVGATTDGRTVPGDASPGPGRFAELALEPYLYLSPALILLALVMFVPLIVGLSYAFRDIQILNPFATGWVGLAHFEALLDDRTFYRALGNTLWWTGGSLILQFGLGLGLALLLNRPFGGRRLVQAVVFLPWAVPTFLTGLTWAWLFNPVIGPLPHWLAALGILADPHNILGDPAIAMWGPIVAITVLLRTIWISNFADLIVVMTNGGPANATQILPSYIFTTAYKKLDFGYASAIATALLALLLLYAMLLIHMRRALPDTR